MGGYVTAKAWQERLVREAAARQGFPVTFLRPGFIWGPGQGLIAGMGRRMGRLHFMFGPSTELPLCHVENCADAIVRLVNVRAETEAVFNVVDTDVVSVRQYCKSYYKNKEKRPLLIPVPYLAGLGIAHLAQAVSKLFFGPRGKLPSLLIPRRFEAQFKPLTFSNAKIRQATGWTPPLDFATAAHVAFGQRGVLKPAAA